MDCHKVHQGKKDSVHGVTLDVLNRSRESALANEKRIRSDSVEANAISWVRHTIGRFSARFQKHTMDSYLDIDIDSIASIQ
jgi:hypothetical protein